MSDCVTSGSRGLVSCQRRAERVQLPGRILRSRAGVAFRIIPSILVFVCIALIGGHGGVPVAAAPGYSFGNENSWIRVQNIGSDNANVEIDYFDESGKLAAKDSCPSTTCPTMYPGSGWTFFQRDNPSLPQGFQGSAVISTDQPIVALLAKDVYRGSLYSIGGSTMTTGVGSHRLYLPLVGKREGAAGTWNGRFVVQNMSDTVQACVTMTYLGTTTDDEIAWDPYRPGAASTTSAAATSTGSPTAGCPSGGIAIAPRGSLFRSV